MALCLTVFFMQFSFFREGPASFGVVIFAAQFGILMPGQLAGEMLAQRRPRMAYEMLLPVSRTQAGGRVIGRIRAKRGQAVANDACRHWGSPS